MNLFLILIIRMENLPVIPQNLGTCWFNAILTAMIYSDGLSQIVYRRAVEDNWQLDETGAFKTIILLFMNYIRAIKKNDNSILIQRFQDFINKYKIEIILLDYLTHYQPELVKYFYKYINSGLDTSFFISILFKSLRLNLSSLILFTNISGTSKRYNLDIQYEYDERDKLIPKRFTGIMIDNIPDILICKTKKDLEMSIKLGYPSITQVKDFGKEIMIFRGVRYKLDCILLDDRTKKHIITGLTCDGSKYVYNGWWGKSGKPCNLMSFEWDTDIRDFCLDLINCRLPDYDPNDKDEDNYCFNFNENNRILVYVKVEEKDDEPMSRKQVKKINPINIYKHIDEYSEKQIKDILMNFYGFSKLRGLNINDLKQLLREELRKELGEDYEFIEGNNDLSSVNSNISKIIIKILRKFKNSKEPNEIEEIKNFLEKLIRDGDINGEVLAEINKSFKLTIENDKQFLDFIKIIYEKKMKKREGISGNRISKKSKT